MTSDGGYTYEVVENIGTTGFGVTNLIRYRVHIRNASGDIVKTDYAVTATLAALQAQRAIAKLERKGGSIIERAARRKEQREAHEEVIAAQVAAWPRKGPKHK